MNGLQIYKNTNYTRCPNDFSYFSTLQFLTTFANSTSFISIPSNLFAIYCILFKTPPRMKEMRWSLLNLQIWTFLLDLHYSILLVPFYFFPVSALCSEGYLAKFGFSTEFQYHVEQITTGALFTAILMLFENRHHALVPFTSWFRLNSPILRFFLHIVNFIISCLYIFPLLLIENNTETIKLEMLKVVPCLHPIFFDSRTFAIQQTSAVLNYLPSLGSFLIVLELAFLISHCVYHLKILKQSTGLYSQNGRKIQKTFFIASCVQTLSPLTILVIPMVYMMYSITYSYYNQGFVNVITVVLSLHGVVATIAMISVNKPYRDFVKGPFVKHKPHISEKTVSMARGNTLEGKI